MLVRLPRNSGILRLQSIQQRICLFNSPLSTSTRAKAVPAAAKSNPESSSRFRFFSPAFTARARFLGRVWRYTRIPILVVSVYGVGYQQGIIDDSRNPERTREALLTSVLAQSGIESRADVEIMKDGENRVVASRHSPTTRRVAAVGKKIVKVGLLYVEQQRDRAVVRVRQTLPEDANLQQIGEALAADEEFVKWTEAFSRLEGQWSYLLLKTPVPNAFVTEVVPRSIFISRGMFQIIGNDDELALVLGHELSHQLLGHGSQSNHLELILRLVEVVLLSMDPTDGVLTLAFVGGLATLRTGIAASFSREHEREADDLGMKLAAMACYDTKRAALVFQKLHETESAPSTTSVTASAISGWLSFANTHPPSDERYATLLKTSETENPSAYSSTTCSSVQRKMQSALWSLR